MTVYIRHNSRKSSTSADGRYRLRSELLPACLSTGGVIGFEAILGIAHVRLGLPASVLSFSGGPRDMRNVILTGECGGIAERANAACNGTVTVVI